MALYRVTQSSSFAAPAGLTFAKGAPTVFHTSSPADAPSTHDRAVPVSFLGGCGHGRYRDPSISGMDCENGNDAEKTVFKRCGGALLMVEIAQRCLL